MLKIDRTTSIHTRGKFVRICVKIDLSKKLVPRISVLGTTLSIEYEDLYLICFSCEKYGHRAEHCLESPVSNDNNHHESNTAEEMRGIGVNTIAEMKGTETTQVFGVDHEPSNNQGVVSESNLSKKINQDPSKFGPWMLVRRQVRRKHENSAAGIKGSYLNKEAHTIMERKNTNKGQPIENGSRFDALNKEDFEGTNVEHNNVMHEEPSHGEDMLIGLKEKDEEMSEMVEGGQRSKMLLDKPPDIYIGESSMHHMEGVRVNPERANATERVNTQEKKIGFDGCFVEEARGFSGGIWCLWNTETWDWDEDKLKEWLPESTVKRIMAMAPPSPWKKADCIAWANTYDGGYATDGTVEKCTDTDNVTCVSLQLKDWDVKV
ncbi:hypothetical protein Ahy_A03g012892 [Arachis hypogaea]|uniref:CCHC-type domain-containing protein n=1 Tax=Arachis hypogaea TaxID=3818 RepID=A0A445DUD9_ARAHY|nr:hypothetical protein Ahy_A03g012892 [Arachis hypogaea]